MVTIFQKDAPVLRETAQPVPLADITSPRIKKIIADMKKAMRGEDDAVGIAAPQIGVPLRIFVVAGIVFAERDSSGKHADGNGASLPPDRVFVNPKLIKQSRKKISLEEGCLSVRWWYGDVRRSEKATVRAYDETGARFTYGGSGLLAQIFQHEIDHLNGTLFIDAAKNLRKVPSHK